MDLWIWFEDLSQRVFLLHNANKNPTISLELHSYRKKSGHTDLIKYQEYGPVLNVWGKLQFDNINQHLNLWNVTFPDLASNKSGSTGWGT